MSRLTSAVLLTLAFFNCFFSFCFDYILSPLAPLKDNTEVKRIWLRIRRGSLEDYGSVYGTFEEWKKDGNADSYEEYEKSWKLEFPDEICWFELAVVKSFNTDGSLRYYGITFDHENVISARTDDRNWGDQEYYAENAAVKLCELIAPAVQDSVNLLMSGEYNDVVAADLPYQFRAGIIRHSDVRAVDPKDKERDYDGLSEEMVAEFKQLIASGKNNAEQIGRIRNFTANDFFRACKIGYKAIGKDCDGYSLPELYMRYSDGRDEGLTGMGHGLNEGPGIDFDSPNAWDEWYFSQRGGDHPWEVVPGGNSTHMELYVCSDKQELRWKLHAGEITQAEYDMQMKSSGYYFVIAGMQRQFESVSFYVALCSAGLPVIIGGAKELISRFEATDYIGVVPHHLPTRYCESLFPDEYGEIINFTHVYKGEDLWFDKIVWLPEEQAFLTADIQKKQII